MINPNINFTIDLEKLNWEKNNGLMPAIIQDQMTHQVLMLGHMNKAALQETIKTGKVTFYSRTKKRLWTKGETSGHFLMLINIVSDCDNDALLVIARPNGPTCHFNRTSCFEGVEGPNLNIFTKIESIINDRYERRPEQSYVATLFNEGLVRIAQKVGEEGLEVALASVTGQKTDIINEVADLLFHLLVLLRACRIKLMDVTLELNERAEKSIYPSLGSIGR
jgi:phosphoribosyl-ATP pyrophosphohydrolase/phosphoribosyl-AMP cyclohydrolase